MKLAVSDSDAFTASGVQEQVAVVVAETFEQPVIVIPPALKVTVPGVFTVEVITTGVLNDAVRASLGKASDNVDGVGKGDRLLQVTPPIGVAAGEMLAKT